VLHLLRTGSPWRDLPPELGDWRAVSMRFRRREARGVWRRLWQHLQSEPFAGARDFLWIRPQCARIHTRRARPQKNADDQALGRSRGGFSTKIHAARLDENGVIPAINRL
jgi:transposase